MHPNKLQLERFEDLGVANFINGSAIETSYCFYWVIILHLSDGPITF